jgi:hypothetical protein
VSQIGLHDQRLHAPLAVAGKEKVAGDAVVRTKTGDEGFGRGAQLAGI